jgi:general secretion pathway protein A
VSLNYVKRPTSLVDVAAASQQAQADALTYEPHFGLTEKPFSLNADARFVYESTNYVATRDALLAGIRRREGLQVLTGQIGTGKTTLCRAALASLGRNTYTCLVPDPFASREDLLKMMLIDFGASSIQEIANGPLRQASRTELGYVLAEFVEKLPREAFAIAIIDEAQNLSPGLIEETRILSDTFGASGQLQIVFVGQPELHARLKSPEMRQVDQRVCGYHRLSPMTGDAVAGYIHHRLRTAGLPPGRVLFPAEIVAHLHGRTGGVPRLINRVCDRALQLAYERGAAQVDRELLDTALIEVGNATLSPTWDSIMFAETAARTTLPEPAKPAIAESTEAPAAVEIAAAEVAAAEAPAETLAVAPTSPVMEGDAAPAPASTGLEYDESFKKEVEHWVTQELSSPSRPLTPRRRAADESRPAKRQSSPAPGRREAEVRAEWARDFRSETYMHRLGRLWAKWIAVAVAVVVTLNLGSMAASFVSTLAAPTALPPAPLAPKPTLPADVPATPVSVSFASADYLVAVGLFEEIARADRLVDSLSQEGLAAMQRTVTINGQPMQQIVLGPFFSRPEAMAELVRLQMLGGYPDARLINGNTEP